VRHRLLLASAVLCLLGCDPSSTPLPTAPPIVPTGPVADLRDGAHGPGNQHFFFLPPVVPKPAYAGDFDPSVSPVVEICERANGTCATLLAAYTTTTGPGSETVRLDATAEQYIVNWHTDQFSLSPDKVYRVRVQVAGTELGYADVQSVSNARELKNVNTGEYVPLVDGRTLVIKFRIERGSVYVVTPPAPGGPPAIFTTLDGRVTMSVPPGAISEPVGITAQQVPTPPNISHPDIVGGSMYEFGPDGAVFGQPITVTLKYDPTKVRAGRAEESLRLVTLVDGAWQVVAESTVDPQNHTVTAQLQHFSTYAVQSLRRIAFTATSSRTVSGYAVYIAYEDGTGLRRLVDGYAPAWSPDGARIAYVCDDYQLYPHPCLVSPDGGTPTSLPKAPGFTEGEFGWSPDGTDLVYQSGTAVVRVPVTAPEQSAIVFNGAPRYAYNPDWSAARGQIAFAGDWREPVTAERGSSELYVVNPDGSGFTRLPRTGDAIEWSPRWTPDGNRIVFAFRAGWEEFAHPDAVGILDLTTGSRTTLVSGLDQRGDSPYGLFLRLTPDGSRVAFFAFGPNGGTAYGGIWTVRLDGTALTKIRRRASLRR
jgi:hypothetical protein